MTNINDEEIIYEEEGDAAKMKIEQLKEKLDECRQEKEEYLAGWQRAQADLINYKRRQEEQTGFTQKLLFAELISKLLPILDDLDSGAEKMEEIKLLRDKFKDILREAGLREIKVVGAKFDPNLHEAIESVEQESGEDGTVMEELQRGYVFADQVIRPSKVKVIKNSKID